jgi:hypothetical protein
LSRPEVKIGDEVKMGNLLDITGAEAVEIVIRDDGKVIWVNTERGCVLRICRIKHLTFDDRRKRK